MKKLKNLMITVLVVALLLVFAACNQNTDDVEIKAPKTETQTEVEQAEESEINNKNAPTAEDIVNGNLFVAQDKSIYFEYDIVTDGGDAMHMNMTMTPEYIRADTKPGDDEYPVIVFNLKDESAFMYVLAGDTAFGGEYSYFPLFNELSYTQALTEYADTISDLERTTLDGRDVIYGKAVVDEDEMVFWYSEEYGIMLKYVLTDADGTNYDYTVTHIEEKPDIPADFFAKPAGITFFDLGEIDPMAIEGMLNP